MTKYIEFVMQMDLGLEKKKKDLGQGGGGNALIVFNALGFYPAHQRIFFLTELVDCNWIERFEREKKS